MTISPYVNRNYCSMHAREKIEMLNNARAFGRRLNQPTLHVYATVLRVLWTICNADERKYVSSNGGTIVTCKEYQVRKSWENIVDYCGQAGIEISERHLRRVCNDFIGAGLMRKFHEKKGPSASKGVPAFEDLMGPARFPMWKVIEMIPFDIPEPTYEEITAAVEHLIEQVNSEPAMVEVPVENIAIAANLEEHVPDLDPRDFNIDEEIHESCPTKTTAITNTVLSTDKGRVHDTCLSDNFERPLVTPNTESDEDWKAEVIKSLDGRSKRQVMARRSFPKYVNGCFYATWMLERAGLFWAPWVIWDVDASGEETVEDSFRRAKGFTERLIRIGVPLHAMRVVFSTNKGFHVYLDSRCIGLKPMPEQQLLDTIKAFCMRMLPSTDPMLYRTRQLIGLPNSRHSKTGKFYTILSIGEFLNGSIEDFHERAEVPGEALVRSKDVQEIPALTGGFVSAAQIKKQLAPSFDEITKHIERREFYGVQQGGRDVAMFELACKYKRMLLNRDEIVCLVLYANKRNRPPLDEKSIVAKIDKMFRFSR